MSFIRNALPRRSSSHSQQQQQVKSYHQPANLDLNPAPPKPSSSLSHKSKPNLYTKELPPPPDVSTSRSAEAVPPPVIPHHIQHPPPPASSIAPRSMKRKNLKQLSLTPAAPVESPRQTSYKVVDAVSTNSDKGICIEAKEIRNPTSNSELISKFSTLELNVEFNLDIRAEDIEVLSELGSGNGGTVSKARHIPTGLIMARKVIPIEAKKEVRKQIVRELHITRDCNFPHIVSYFGAFLNQGDVVMCMEYMDRGSLDRIYKKHGAIPEPIVGKITEAVVEGLDYLYDKHRIIHRDVKPSNVLVNAKGEVKLCDFGVSGELNNSIADTFVGTSTYMSPERIQGAAYSVKSDVWSLGITVLELAVGYFPWDEPNEEGKPSSQPLGILDMLQRIVLEPPPQVPANGKFSEHFRQFVKRCLLTEDQRPTPKDLFKDAFFIISKRTPVALDKWAQQL